MIIEEFEEAELVPIYFILIFVFVLILAIALKCWYSKMRSYRYLMILHDCLFSYDKHNTNAFTNTNHISGLMNTKMKVTPLKSMTLWILTKLIKYLLIAWWQFWEPVRLSPKSITDLRRWKTNSSLLFIQFLTTNKV